MTSDFLFDRARCMAERAAEQAVHDPAVILELMRQWEKDEDVAGHLARCFANLGMACKGERHAVDAITTTLSNAYNELVARHYLNIRDSYTESCAELEAQL